MPADKMGDSRGRARKKGKKVSRYRSKVYRIRGIHRFDSVSLVMMTASKRHFPFIYFSI